MGLASPARRSARWLIVADTVAVVTALSVGVLASWGEPEFTQDSQMRAGMVLFVAAVWSILLWRTESRKISILGDGPEEYRRVLVASAWTVVLVAATGYFLGATLGRGFLLLVMALGTVLLLVGRHLIRRRIRKAVISGPALHRVFVVAAPQERERVEKELAATDGLFDSVGFGDLAIDEALEPHVIVRLALDSGADTILCAPSPGYGTEWIRRLLWELEGESVDLVIAQPLARIAQPRLSIQPVEGLPLLRVEKPRFSGPARATKRLIDVIGSVVLLAVSALPLLIVAVVIRLDSPGGVFFRQERAGQGGTTFRIWKFRTMRVGADAERAALRAEHGDGSATFKMVDDPRITRVGGFLRRFSIDELPQLLNVLHGEMSLVGPRPHPMDDVALYDEQAHRRLLAKPGMTGLWQVSGRSDVKWEDAVPLDLYYVENWSLSVDLLIALRTAKAVIKGSGAH